MCVCMWVRARGRRQQVLWRTEEGIWSLTSGGRDLTVGPPEEEQVLLTASLLCSPEALPFLK